MPNFSSIAQLDSSNSGSIALADILQIKGAFKVYNTIGDRDAVTVEQFSDNQIVFVSASNELYRAEIIPANPPFNFTTTLNWHSFTFPGSGEGGSGIFAPTGSVQATSNNLEVTGSLTLQFDTVIDPLTITSGSVDVLKVNNEGVLTLSPRSAPPTYVSGGLWIDTLGNFYAG
jgi:hypothetical protein